MLRAPTVIVLSQAYVTRAHCHCPVTGLCYARPLSLSCHRLVLRAPTVIVLSQAYVTRAHCHCPVTGLCYARPLSLSCHRLMLRAPTVIFLSQAYVTRAHWPWRSAVTASRRAWPCRAERSASPSHRDVRNAASKCLYHSYINKHTFQLTVHVL